MRTPSPSVPPDRQPGGYRTTRFDQEGPDDGFRLRAAVASGMVFAVALGVFNLLGTRKLGLGGWMAGLFTLGASSLCAVFTFRLTLGISDAAGAVARAVTLPSGASTPYEEGFSYQDALAARGDVAGAFESLEAVIAERPGVTAPRLKAAELYARRGKDARRAAALVREVRDLPGVSSRDALYAASRLVDLYEGPLAEPGAPWSSYAASSSATPEPTSPPGRGRRSRASRPSARQIRATAERFSRTNRDVAVAWCLRAFSSRRGAPPSAPETAWWACAAWAPRARRG